MIALVFLAVTLAGCAGFPAKGPVVNSGSYDWTDQVRDAQGWPLPGWASTVYQIGGGADCY